MCRRLSLTKITAVTIIITFSIIIWNIFSIDDEDDRSEIINSCNMTIDYLNNLDKLLQK